MITASGLPKNLWAEAQYHAGWVRNRTPTSAIPNSRTPHEVATGEKPNLAGIIPWGNKVWVKKLDATKLSPRAVEGRFIGYDEESKGCRIYWP
ncbi:copia protein, partial [Auriscalpium vulgare]